MCILSYIGSNIKAILTQVHINLTKFSINLTQVHINLTKFSINLTQVHINLT